MTPSPSSGSGGSVERRPNFFIVGAPKSGTTAMNSYLQQHPDIFMAKKEMHFFSPDLLRDQTSKAARRTLEWYLEQFTGASLEAVIGEASVFYLCSDEAAERIRDFAPDARILIQVRNPVDFIPSHHSQIVYEGYQDIEDVEAAYDAEDDRRAGRRVPDCCPNHKVLLYREMAGFSGQISRYFEVFGRDRVLVTVFDDFEADPAAAYQRTLSFLGVEESFAPAFDVVNPNKEVKSMRLQRFIRRTPQWVTTLSRMVLSKPARDRLKAGIRLWNTRYVRRRPVATSFRERLKREMTPEVERLGALLGRDLTHWIR